MESCVISFLNKVNIKVGSLEQLDNILIPRDSLLIVNYNESEVSDYMKNGDIDINVDISNGSKNFTVYTMDLTKKYIDINADYRS